jgi:hypothetical protein
MRFHLLAYFQDFISDFHLNYMHISAFHHKASYLKLAGSTSAYYSSIMVPKFNNFMELFPKE